jgi:hypothetical protein
MPSELEPVPDPLLGLRYPHKPALAFGRFSRGQCLLCSRRVARKRAPTSRRMRPPKEPACGRLGGRRRQIERKPQSLADRLCCLQRIYGFTAETQSAQRGQGISPASGPLRTVGAGRRRSPLAGDREAGAGAPSRLRARTPRDAYERLCPVVGIHLLDFDLFRAQEHRGQAVWCFEMRDLDTPNVCLGDELQLNSS